MKLKGTTHPFSFVLLFACKWKNTRQTTKTGNQIGLFWLILTVKKKQAGHQQWIPIKTAKGTFNVWDKTYGQQSKNESTLYFMADNPVHPWVFLKILTIPSQRGK